MGTPEFAVGILDAVVQNQYEVVGVITAPDKPAGRGQKIKYSAVKEYALAHGLTLLQPTNLKDPGFLEELRNLGANVQVVVAFRMLPQVVWSMPEYGTFNLHASLLPNYRGAAPINWAIINGETQTGVTTFFIDDKIDTGAMILRRSTEIDPQEDAGQLHDRLMKIGSQAVLDTLKLIGQGDVQTTLQTETQELKTAHKLHRDNCKINWQLPGQTIYNLIRGLAPFPTAWCYIEDLQQEWNVKIYQAEFVPGTHTLASGSIILQKKEMLVAVQDGWIRILSLQMPGKKRMSATELLNGVSWSEKARAY